MGEAIRFEGRLEPTEGGLYVVVPDEAVAALGATGRTSVVGTIDGHALRNQVMPYTFDGIGRQVVLGVTRSVRTAIGKSEGEIVELVLERDDRPRSADVELPIELVEVLAADPEAGRAFERLAPSHRREQAEFVADAKREDTRRRRAATVVARLRPPD
ncbi:MAG: YdeI/OmpD-associated family protein [Chloroflexota bacterium]